MSALAVIPARGGSKRLPGKNVLDFGGRPMLAWTVDAAVGSGRFDRVLVSTDDPAIAAVAEGLGLEVPFLRDHHTDDHVTSSEVTIGVLDRLEDRLGERYEVVAQLLPNCPLRDVGHVVRSHEAFVASGAPAQISCTGYGWTKPWWAATVDDAGHPTPLFPAERSARSQDLPELWCPTGAVWWAQVDVLRRDGTFYAEGHRFEPIDWWAAADIDDAEDLERALVLQRWRDERRG